MNQEIKEENFITLDDEEYFEKILFENSVVYRCRNYPGPLAINATVIERNEELLGEND